MAIDLGAHHLKQKTLLIVARYQEDISWLQAVDCDVIIYNKGETFEYPWPRTDIPNKGREAETYLRAILEIYPNLHNYDRVAFMQGNPFDHYDRALQLFDEETTTWTRINGGSVNFDFATKDFIGNYHYLIISKLLDGCLVSKANLNWKGIEEPISVDDEFMKIMVWCTLLGIDFKGKSSFWGPGAQYIVPVRFILNKSLDWWQKCYELMDFSLKYANLDPLAPGDTFERIWPLIWDHSD
jgi:hypothetical protein